MAARPRARVRLLRPVASALAAAHRRGLVHRDVKPANVLIATSADEGDEHVYLTDFGIAQRTESRGMTRTGVLVGTIDYMAPERIEGGTGHARLGHLRVRLHAVRDAHRPRAVRSAHRAGEDVRPHQRPGAAASGLPASMEPIVRRAMAKRPEDRFGSAAELVAALDAAHSRRRQPTCRRSSRRRPRRTPARPPSRPIRTSCDGADPAGPAMAPDPAGPRWRPIRTGPRWRPIPRPPTRPGSSPETAETPPAPPPSHGARRIPLRRRSRPRRPAARA